MLRSIKATIDNLPDEDFGSFYQRFIMHYQDEIIDSDLRIAHSHYASGNLLELVSGLNKLTEELKFL